MEQPPGFVAHGEYGLVYKLCRSLYVLKQSPQTWFGMFNHIIHSFGMKHGEANHYVFYCHTFLGKCVFNSVW